MAISGLYRKRRQPDILRSVRHGRRVRGAEELWKAIAGLETIKDRAVQ